MVFPDSFEAEKKSSHSGRMPSVADRILAFALDFAILFPICQVLVAPLWRRIETLLYTSPRSMELVIIGAIVFAVSFAVCVIYQALFLHFAGATPGKFFMKLRVVSVATGKNPEWASAFVRSFTWCVEFVLFFGVPFLEVLGQRHRRTAHDRLSETMVVTLKVNPDQGPHPLETKFVRQILVLFAAVVFVWAGAALLGLHDMARRGEFSQKELQAQDYLCDRVSKASKNRVDEALALFLLGQIDDECLQKETDFALWTQSEDLHAWAYLAQSFVNQSDRILSDEYLQQSCSGEGEGAKEACELSKKISAKDADHNFVWSSITARVLHLESLKRAGKFKELLASLKKFPVEGFREALSDYQLKALWASNRKEEARGIFSAQTIFTGEKFKVEEAAWICFQELQQGCDLNRTISSCDMLSAQTSFDSAAQAWTSLKLRECKSQSAEDNRLYSVDDQDFLDLFQAYRSEEPEDRKRNLLKVANKIGPGEIQNYVLLELIQLSSSEEDFKQIHGFLENLNNRDWNFLPVVMKAFSKASQKREYKVAYQLSELVDSESFRTWNLSRDLIMASYWAGHKDEALALLKKLPAEAPVLKRAIASEVQSDWEVVRAALFKNSIKDSIGDNTKANTNSNTKESK